jgi:6-phosphogluconolactonase/glucosamine-6-phosphate isomerase/deaminase
VVAEPPGEPSVEVEDDPSERAAHLLADHLRRAVETRGRATLAVSGGHTGPPMLAALASADLAWDHITVFQVDERVAPDGDPARNADALVGFPARVNLMPVTEPDLEQAAARYASELPDRFDVVHLGMGPDGHTASWPPGDAVINRTESVALSGEYQGHVRMTITPLVVNAALARLVLITGTDKAPAVATWLTTSSSDLPISRVKPADTTVILDSAAAADLPSTAGG